MPWQRRLAAVAALAGALLPVPAAAHAPLIGLSRKYLNFTTPPGGVPNSQSVTLTNETHGRMAWSAAVSTAQGGPWLRLSPTGGVLPGTGTYEWVSLGVSIAPAGLGAGVYYGTITITAPGDSLGPGASNSPQIIEVALTIGSGGQSAPGIGVSSNAVSFEASTAAARTANQILQVSNTGGGTLNWTATTETTTGGSWLSISPASGSNAGTITVGARVTGLARGTYNGRITLTAPAAANSPQYVSVSLTLRDPGVPLIRVSPAALTFTAMTETRSLVPERLDIVNGGEGSLNWRAQMTIFNGGAWLSAGPLSGAVPAAMTISADPSGLPPGSYAARLTFTADGAGNSPLEVPIQLLVRRPQPLFDPRGVVHGATFRPTFLAAGQIVTIFGAELGPEPGVGFELDPVTGRMPDTLAGTRITFDGLAAPLFYASSTQVNFQVPVELAGRSSTRMVVSAEGLEPAEATLPLREAAPGVFTINGTQAAALNEDGTLNSAANPAPRGSVIQLFLSGQGQTDPPLETGMPAPLAPPFPAPLLPVTVTMDGAAARVVWTGAAPGFVGLLQVNVEVPAGLTPSSQVNLAVLVGPNPANQRVTVAVR
jgi:uncharacterized protein (TIGR03437 family)